MWDQVFKKDTFVLGLILGIVLPAVFYGLLFLMDMAVVSIFGAHMLARQDYLLLLSTVINLFAIKYYFVNLKYDKTGRGVLIVTFALALLYFALY